MNVLIPDSDSGHTLAVAQSLQLIDGIDIFLISNKIFTPSRLIKSCKGFKVIKSNDLNIKTIIDYAHEIKADIILPVDEYCTKLFSENLQDIQALFPTIPIPPIHSFIIATNKRLLANFCKSNEINVPKTWSFEDFKHLLFSSSESNIFPVIIKPESGNGGKNIILVNSREEFETLSLQNLEPSFGNYFIQEFIEGFDIDMSVLCNKGKILSYTIQRGIVRRKSNFAASAGIQFLDEPKLFTDVKYLMEKLNYSGIAHLDLRFDVKSEKFVLIEINSRFWGSLIGSTNAGVNFPYLACLAGLKKELNYLSFKKNRYIDLITLLRNPRLIKEYKFKLKETNFAFITDEFLANIINQVQRV